MDKLLKLLGLSHLTPDQKEVLIPVAVIAAVMVLIVLILCIDRLEEIRIRRWNKRQTLQTATQKPWRTLIPWHRAGSRWFEARVDGSATPCGVESLRKKAAASSDDGLYKNINKTIRIHSNRFAKRR